MRLIEALETRTLFATYTAGNAAELLAAMNEANASPAADTINLVPGSAITLRAAAEGESGTPVLRAAGGAVTINGAGSTIERAAGATTSFRLFTTEFGASLRLNSMTLKNGRATGTGGAVRSSSSLELNGVRFGGNSVVGSSGALVSSSLVPGGDGRGGAVYAGGLFSMTDCTFEGNTATGGRGATSQRSLSWTPYGNTMVAPNKGGHGMGGAVYFSGNAATIRNCTFTGNSAIGGAGGSAALSTTIARGGYGGTGLGGAVFISGVKTTTFINVTATGNAARGGIGGTDSRGVPSGSRSAGAGGAVYVAKGYASFDAFSRINIRLNTSTSRSPQAYDDLTNRISGLPK